MSQPSHWYMSTKTSLYNMEDGSATRGQVKTMPGARGLWNPSNTNHIMLPLALHIDLLSLECLPKDH